MTKFVRVKLENGALATVSDAVAEAAGYKPLDPEKHPALDKKGRPLPPEYPEKDEQPPAQRPALQPIGDKPDNQPTGS